MTENPVTEGTAAAQPPGRPVHILRDLPQFRYFWLSKAISSIGTGVGRVALVLLVAPSGPGAVTLVLIGTALPLLAGPLAGAVADRVDQRRLLAGCEAGQAASYGILALTRPPLPVLMLLVVLASLLSTFGSPAGKSAIRRLVPAGRRPQATALLGLGSNLQIILGPSLGGLLAGLSGVSVAFGVNAASFAISALLLTRLAPLPPMRAPSSGADSRPATLLGDTMAGLRYAGRNRVLRGLVIGMLVFVTFAAIDNVALVFLVRGPLRGSGTEYGLIAATFGAGMVAASVALTAFAGRRPPTVWLVGGIIAGAVGTVATGIAPSAAVACVGQVVAGVGNTADLVGTDTIVQQRVPAHMTGRAFGSVYASAQLASVLSYLIAGPLVALAGPRTAFVIAGAGALAGAAVLLPALREHADEVSGAAESIPSEPAGAPGPVPSGPAGAAEPVSSGLDGGDASS